MLCYIVSAQIDAVSMYVCFIFMIKHMVFKHTYIDTHAYKAALVLENERRYRRLLL